MFRLFKNKTELEKLQDKYKSLMKEWHALSSVNRALSDIKYAEAEAVAKQIEALNS